MSKVQKQSVMLNGRRTSVSLEPEFYEQVRRMADERGGKIADLIAEVAAAPDVNNVSSELRLAVLRDLRAKAFPAPLSQADAQ